MTDAVARKAAEPMLRARGPGYAVMQECLRIQLAADRPGKMSAFFGRSPLHPDARSWYRGALGEIEVARALNRLGPEWTILHAVPVGAEEADIDHVVVGPGGIFTINTKNHSTQKVWAGGNTFMVNGRRYPHIHASTSEAANAARRISQIAGTDIVVQGLIVVVRPATLTLKKPNVPVLASSELARWLRKRPVVNSQAVIAGLSMIVEERSTWHRQPIVHTDTLRHQQRFHRLQKEVEAAARRQRGWKLAALGTLLGTLLVTAGSMWVLLMNAAGA